MVHVQRWHKHMRTVNSQKQQLQMRRVCSPLIRNIRNDLTCVFMFNRRGHTMSSGGSSLGEELTDEEKEIINGVLARAAMMEAVEQERIQWGQRPVRRSEVTALGPADSLLVSAGVCPVVWTASRRRRAGTDSPTVCSAGRPLVSRRSQLSSVHSVKKYEDVFTSDLHPIISSLRRQKLDLEKGCCYETWRFQTRWDVSGLRNIWIEDHFFL